MSRDACADRLSALHSTELSFLAEILLLNGTFLPYCQTLREALYREVAHGTALLGVAQYIRKTGSCTDLNRKTGKLRPPRTS